MRHHRGGEARDVIPDRLRGVKFHLTYDTSRCFGYDYGNGFGYGYGNGNGDGYGFGYGYGNGYGYGYNYGFGYDHGDGCARVKDHIHPRASADDDLRVAIQTAALQPLLHLEEL